MLPMRRLTHLWIIVVAVTSSALDAHDGPRDNRQRSGDETGGGRGDQAEHSTRKLLAVVNTVLEHDVAPPTRQQMVLEATKALFAKAGKPLPSGLSRSISHLATDEQIAGFLRKTLVELFRVTDGDVRELEAAMMGGALSAVPGNPELIAPDDFKFHEQFRTKGYVGVGITIALDEETRSPLMIDVRPGPALHAGAQAGDLILEVDGTNTEKAALQTMVSLLRGGEGTPVALVVRQKGASEKRALAITRGLAPVATVVGFQRLSEATWDYHAIGDERIAYLRVAGIRTKTVHELREAARLLEDQGFRAIVLDLRTADGRFGAHPAILLADELLDGGAIGRVHGTDGRVRQYDAAEGGLFRGWPIVVLVNRVTRGEAEFLAAALQDNRRAVLVGECTSGDAYESSVISCGDDIGAVALHTAVLHRGDGRSLLRHDVDRSPHSETIADTRAPVTAPVEKPTVTWGVEPDHHVPMDDNQLMEMFKAQREREIFDANAAKGEDGFADRQIQKAIELLESALEAEAG